MPSLGNVSLGDLQREIQRRQRSGKTLLRRRAKLAAKLDALDAQIAALGINAGGNGHAGRTRPKNEMNLVDALVKAVGNKTVTVGEAMEAVQKSGYRTSAANFRVIVNQTLINSGKFKRVDRGQYAVK